MLFCFLLCLRALCVCSTDMEQFVLDHVQPALQDWRELLKRATDTGYLLNRDNLRLERSLHSVLVELDASTAGPKMR